MKKRKIWFFGFLIITIFVFVILGSGSPLLTIALGDTGIPAGNLFTWAGMIALPLSIYMGARELRSPTSKLNAVLSAILKVVLILAVFWMPISFLLAGNLSFIFSERDSFQGGQTAMKLFWLLSYGIGIAAISVLLMYWIIKIFRKSKRI